MFLGFLLNCLFSFCLHLLNSFLDSKLSIHRVELWAHKHENHETNRKRANKPNLMGSLSFFWMPLHKQLCCIRTKPLPNEIT